MITPPPGPVLAARLLPLIDHPDPEVVETATRAAALGGAPTVEIGLRHPNSLEALRRAAAAVTIPVGAGTVTRPEQVDAALAAGAAYLVSPGWTPGVAAAVARTAAAWLPAASTPTEVLLCRDEGASLIKVFPAGPLGGPAYLRALAAVTSGLRFVPTGGITELDAAAYLAVDAVAAVGGSWMFGAPALAARDEQTISAAVRQALGHTTQP